MGSSRRSWQTDRNERVRAVEAGQVACPRRGAADVERCFLCSSFRGFQEGITEGLVCAYESVLGIPDFSPGMDVSSQLVDTPGRHRRRCARASGQGQSQRDE
jgi:hypothetical protein